MGIGDDTSKGTPLEDFVNTTINSSDVVIFSKSYCPPCIMVKNVFDKLKQPYTAINVDSREDCFEIQQILGKLTGASTVPRVFVKGKSVGGTVEVVKLYSSGQLKKMLK